MTPHMFARLHKVVFSGRYPGYIPQAQEAPHGDGNWDIGKRYAHIALKYLNQYEGELKSEMEQLLQAHTRKAVGIAIELGLPQKFWPVIDDANIRILEYPAGCGSEKHTDFDLFTTLLYRNLPDKFRYHPPGARLDEGHRFQRAALLDSMKEKYPGLHFGELMDLINPTAYTPTWHSVDSALVTQYSAVYFAMPRLDVHLPNGLTVEEWLIERKKRSRRYT